MPTATRCLRGSLTRPAPWCGKVPAAPDLAWLDRHGWAWNPARLDELIRAAGAGDRFTSAAARTTSHELAGRFAQVFLLEI